MAHAFSLPEELTIYTSSELRSQLLAWLNAAPTDPEGCALNGEAVLEADGAGVQLLVALRHSLVNRGIPWHWAGISPPLLAACTELGCAPVLGLPPQGGHP